MTELEDERDQCPMVKAGEQCLRVRGHDGRHDYPSDPPKRKTIREVIPESLAGGLLSNDTVPRLCPILRHTPRPLLTEQCTRPYAHAGECQFPLRLEESISDNASLLALENLYQGALRDKNLQHGTATQHHRTTELYRVHYELLKKKLRG